TLGLGAAWKLVLGVVFVLLVCFLRHGIIGGVKDLYAFVRRKRGTSEESAATAPAFATVRPRVPQSSAAGKATAASRPAGHAAAPAPSGPILRASGLSKHYGGVIANADIDFTVNHGELRGIIGPNGAGKSTFFKMLTCEVPPTSGKIVFEGLDITGM